MKEMSISWARANFYTLLKEVACGETIVITKRGRPVARLTVPEAPDREGAFAAAKTLRGLRQRIGWATTEDILQMRDAGRIEGTRTRQLEKLRQRLQARSPARPNVSPAQMIREERDGL